MKEWEGASSDSLPEMEDDNWNRNHGLQNCPQGQNCIIPLCLDPYVSRLYHSQNDIPVTLQRSCVLKMRSLSMPATCLPGLQILNDPCQDHLWLTAAPRSYKYLSLSSPSFDSLWLPCFGLSLAVADSINPIFLSFTIGVHPVVSGQWLLINQVLSRFVRNPSYYCRTGRLWIVLTNSSKPPPQICSICHNKPNLTTHVSSKYFVEPVSIGFVLFVLRIKSPGLFGYMTIFVQFSYSSVKV